MQPVIIFENENHAREYLRYWQRVLQLDDWIIDIRLQYDTPLIAPDWGSSSNWRAIHIAEINIPMPTPGQINGFPERYCQEDILVHELLHILLPGTRVNTDTTEGDFYQNEMHAKLENIAKSLLMARYGITREWFCNF